jgi:hypothetical protein
MTCAGFVIDLLLLITLRLMAARARELLREDDAPELPEPVVAQALPA